MSRVARLLLVWLIASAVPMKGLAAAAMPGCGPGHAGAAVHGMAQDAAATAANDTHEGYRGSGPLGEHNPRGAHDAAGPADAGARGAFDDGSRSAPAGEKAPQPQATLKCSGCAPCNAAAAPAPCVPQLPRIAPAHIPAAFGGLRYAGIVVDVPHRPPRLNLA